MVIKAGTNGLLLLIRIVFTDAQTCSRQYNTFLYEFRCHHVLFRTATLPSKNPRGFWISCLGTKNLAKIDTFFVNSIWNAMRKIGWRDLWQIGFETVCTCSCVCVCVFFFLWLHYVWTIIVPRHWKETRHDINRHKIIYRAITIEKIERLPSHFVVVLKIVENSPPKRTCVQRPWRRAYRLIKPSCFRVRWKTHSRCTGVIMSKNVN